MLEKDEILSKLKQLKPTYEKEGLILLGLFGSYAKSNNTSTSDIDILYDLRVEEFYKNHPGFTAFSRLKSIKDELKNIFNVEVDLCAKNGLSKTGEKHILGNTIYV